MKTAINGLKKGGSHFRVPGYKAAPDRHGPALGFIKIRSPQTDTRSGYRTMNGGR